MTQTEHLGSGGLMLFLAFVGGALVGGAAALLFAPGSGVETRRRITGTVGHTKDIALRMPEAIREAASAGKAAFAAGMEESEGGDAAASTPPRSSARHHS